MKVEWNNEYRLGDMLYSHLIRDKYKNLYRARYPKSIVSEYMKKTDKSIDLDTLESIVKKYNPRIKPNKNTIVIHLRVGDVIKGDVNSLLKKEGLTYTKTLSFYKEAIEDYKDLESITLVAGGCFLKDNFLRSKMFISKIKALYTKMGYGVNVRIEKNADDDFVFMYRAKHFIPSGGKFSDLISQLRKKNDDTILDEMIEHWKEEVIVTLDEIDHNKIVAETRSKEFKQTFTAAQVALRNLSAKQIENALIKYMNISHGVKYPSIKEEDEEFTLKFKWKRKDFDKEEWDGILTYIKSMEFKIISESNYYEGNYEPEEPPERVPTIKFKR